jgi:hypothetical protein
MMEFSTLSLIVSLIVALSVASERLVEIVKGMVPLLNQEQAEAQRESLRQAVLQFLAVVAGIVTAFLTRPLVIELFPQLPVNVLTLLALGLLVSGGSGFWHSVQGYVNSVKDVQQITAQDFKKQKQKQTQSVNALASGTSAVRDEADATAGSNVPQAAGVEASVGL